MAKKTTEDLVYIPETEAAEQAASAVLGGGDTVVVALCHPHGLTFSLKDGRRVKLNGNAANLIGAEKGVLPQGGFGLTVIRRDDWDAIRTQYPKYELFQNGLCFAHEKKNDTIAEAKEKAKVRHGREPVDTSKTQTDPFDGKAS